MKLFEILTEWKAPKFWYHGTSKKAYDKIVQDGYLKPSLADDEEFGSGVWFTPDFEYAANLMRGKMVVLAFDSKNLNQFRHTYSVKGAKDREHYGSDLIIKQNIPLKFVKVVTKPIE